MKILECVGKAVCVLAVSLGSLGAWATDCVKVQFAEFAKSHTVSAVFVKATGGEPLAVNSAMKPYALSASFSSDVAKVDVAEGATEVTVPVRLVADLAKGVTITLMYDGGKFVTMCDETAVSVASSEVPVYEFDGEGGVNNLWMATIPSMVRFNMLTLPGAHDAATSKVSLSASKTQSLTIEEQLEAGVRALDLRPRYTASKESDIELDNLEIYHSSTATGVKWKDAMNAILDFLKDNPTETVLISLLKENTSSGTDYSSTWRTSIRTYLESHKERVVQQITPNMTLADCRGKIVVVSRTPYGSENVYNDVVYGGLVTGWADDGTTTAAEINYTNGSKICDASITDDYNTRTDATKQKNIKANLDAANTDLSTRWYYTFMNVAYYLWLPTKTPSTYAKTHNKYLYDNISTYTGSLGIVFYDYCGSSDHTPELLPALIQHNHKYLYDPSVENNEETSDFIASGDYYLCNAESGKYLTFGTNWGTRASLVDGGGAVVSIDMSGYLHTLSLPEITTAAKGLYLDGSNNPYCDRAPAEFAIKETEEGSNVYTISANGRYLCCKAGVLAEPSAMETTDDGSSTRAMWRLLTRQERIDAMRDASPDNPADATFFIKGAEIDEWFDNAGAWEGTTPNFGGRKGADNGSLEATGFAAEYYAQTGVESYQTITGLPAGKYRLSCYGFYRDGTSSEAYERHNNQTETIRAHLFANDEQTPLSSIMEGARSSKDSDGGVQVGSMWIPDNMGQAVLAFFRKDYPTISLDVTIAKGETLTLGIRKEAGTANKWAIWDRFRLTYLGPVTADVTITDALHTAYVTPFHADFTLTSGLTAYIVTAASTQGATLTEVERAPQGTAVVLKGEEAGQYTIHRAQDAVGEEDVKGNLFMPGGDMRGDEKSIYALGNIDGVGFYLVKQGVLVPADKGYLKIGDEDGTETDIKAFIPFGDGEATAVESVTKGAERTEGAVYNLAGQRVTRPTRGIYIVDGKKVFINK